MNIEEELNEKLRESCCLGDMEGVYKYLSQGANVNSKNKMNGWTPLHWASKRGHVNLVKILLKASADPKICNINGQTAIDVAHSNQISNAINEKSGFKNQNKLMHVKTPRESVIMNEKGFTPNYLKHPAFPYVNKSESYRNNFPTLKELDNSQINHNELVLKVRIANSEDKDFIEVELQNDLTYDNLIKICIEELQIEFDKFEIVKLRKLPNTVIRNDKDIVRLAPFQEVEAVLQLREEMVGFQKKSC